MRAWVVHELGTPPRMELEDVADRPSLDGMVRIKIAAAGVNFFDTLQLAGLYQIKPELPFTPGAEVAGTVLEAPAESGLQAGDRVMAQPRQSLGQGGYAEVTHASPALVRRIPDAMPFEEAAAFFYNYETGWFGLRRRAGLQPGETLLVHAAAGGVGSAAVQLGKAFGARVIATAGGQEKADVARRMGADHVIDYRAADFVEEVKAITGGRGADVIYDPVGGEVFERSTKCVAFEGRLLVVGFASGRFGELRANHVLIKNYAVVGLHWGLYVERRDPLVDECLRDLYALYGEGRIQPYVSRRLPLEEAPSALADVASRRSTGKIVLVP